MCEPEFFYTKEIKDPILLNLIGYSSSLLKEVIAIDVGILRDIHVYKFSIEDREAFSALLLNEELKDNIIQIGGDSLTEESIKTIKNSNDYSKVFRGYQHLKTTYTGTESKPLTGNSL